MKTRGCKTIAIVWWFKDVLIFKLCGFTGHADIF